MKALIAMSGGVDSSVAAKLMVDAGYECIGCTMKLYDNDDAGISSNTCCSLDDIYDAKNVAHKLKIPHYVFNFKNGFRENVIDKFVRSYESGLTPNPCIDCNKYMKFSKLFERADILGCEKIVTGHYARIEYVRGKYVLKKAIDETKDQSYMLCNLTQNQLSRLVFPLGGITKCETRNIAEKCGFLNARKHDSQDICFVPNGDYAEIIKLHSGKDYPNGNFVDKAGNVLGEHRGIINYTVGQRRGLGLSLKEPMYVCRICPDENTVVLGNCNDLYQKELDVCDVCIISGEEFDEIRCKVKLRYRQNEQWANIVFSENNTAHIVFDEAQRAVAPGQHAVFYDGDTVIGSGVIL